MSVTIRDRSSISRTANRHKGRRSNNLHLLWRRLGEEDRLRSTAPEVFWLL